MSARHRVCQALMLVLLVVGLPITAVCEQAATAPAEGPVIEPKALEVIRNLSNYYRDTRTLQARVETVMRIKTQVMDTTMNTRYQLALQRPNRIALVLESGMMGVTLVSDGEQLHVHLPMMNQYTAEKAPETLEALSEAARIPMAMAGGGELFLQPLLAADPGEELLEDVQEGRHAGIVEIDGVKAHHLKFSQDAFDRELWVHPGDQPLIHKIAMDMSRATAYAGEDMPGFMQGMEMQVNVIFRDWEVDEDLPPETFRFEPPEDAEKVDSFFAGFGEDEPHPLLGEAAPPIKLKLLDGGEFDLAAHKGKDIVILDFWATWCVPCVKALPALIEIADEYKDRNVVLYAVNQEESPQTIRTFLERRKLSLKVPLDEDGDAAEAYEVEGIPQTVVIGKDGIIHSVHVGAGPGMKDELREELDALLAGRNLAAEKKEKFGADATEEGEEQEPEGREDAAAQPAALVPAWSATGRWDAVAAEGSSIIVTGVGGQAAQLDDKGQPQREFQIELGIGDIRLARLSGGDQPDLLAFRKWGRAVIAMNAQGERLWSYPGGQGVNDVWPVDLNGDGRHEIIIGYNGFTGVHVVDHTGELLWKNASIGNVWHVSAGDLDGDGKLEVVTTSAQGKVHVFDATGRRLRDLDPGCYANMIRVARIPGEDPAPHLIVCGSVDLRREVLVLLTAGGERKWSLDLGRGRELHVNSVWPAGSRPWAAVGLMGGAVRVVDLSMGRVIAEASGQGNRPQLAWLEPDSDRPPLLLVATGTALNAFRVNESSPLP